MRKKSLILLTICFFAFLSLIGCGKKEVNPNKAIQFLKELNSYTCNLDININNSKQEINIMCKQYYDKRYGNRLNIGNDRVLIYKDKDIYVNDIKNGENYILNKEFDSLYKLSLLQEYIGLLYTNEDIKCSIQTICDKQYELVTLIIPGNNRNLNKAIMYIDLENNFPDKIIISDIKGNEIVKFVYKNFIPNCELEKTIFEPKEKNKIEK